MHRVIRRLAFAFIASSLLCGCATEKPWLTTGQRREIFDAAWTTIADRHYDPKLGGVDWQHVHDEVGPKVDQASNDGEFRSALRELTAALGHSHVNVLPPDDELDGDAGEASGPEGARAGGGKDGVADGVAGFDVSGVEDAMIVVRVHPGSPAEAAGVRVGDEVIGTNGNDLDRIRRRAQERSPERWQGFVPYLIENALAGQPGEAVTATLRAPSGETRDVTLKLAKPDVPRIHFGNLGSMTADFEARRLDGNVQYVRFSPCFTEVLERVNEALDGARDASGVIIDLRGNPGGLGTIAMGVARSFLGNEVDLGVMRTRTDEIHFRVNPSPNPYVGPLVIIVDASSASTSEILASGLQAVGRARVVGNTSMGAALPSVVEKLPYRWRLQTVVADFRLPDGSLVEGRGVVPDVEVKAKKADFAAGRDPYVETALRELANAPRLKPTSQSAPDTAPAATESQPSAIEVSPEAAAVMDAIVTAMGGAERLRSTKSIRTRSTMTVMGLKATIDSLIAAPNRLRVVTDMTSVGETIQVFDGTQCWSADPIQGLRELKGEELAQIRRQAYLDSAARWRESFAKIEIIERTKDGNHDAIVLKQTPLPGEGEPKTVWVDAATHLAYKTKGVSKTAMGKMSTTSEVIEYKEIDGILTETKVVMTVSTGVKVTITTESVERDVPVDDSLFVKPPAPKPRARRTESAPAAKPNP